VSLFIHLLDKDIIVNISYSSEISLRSAIICAKKASNNEESLAKNIERHALNQMELVQKAEGLMTGLKSADNVEKAAISAAINGIEIAYKAISFGLEEAKFKRRQFIEECDKSLATFCIDNNKETSEFTSHELAVKQFYTLMQNRCPDLIEYCGISITEKSEHEKIQFFSVLPFYKMSQSLPQNNIIASKLDQLRQAIYLFLKTGLPLEKYYQKFKDASVTYWKISSLFNADSYLNYYRAPRFIITALANLLWNLQHPVDIMTGTPLCLSEAISLSYDVEMFLNDLLNPSQYPFLEDIDSKSKRLSQSLLKVETFVKALRRGFDYERLHEINLHEVSKHMHSALKVMSNKLLELIYHDELAAEIVVGQIMVMGTLFIQNPLLYIYFYSELPQHTPDHLNPKPCTIIDVLIIFAHLPPSRRLKLCQKLIDSNLEAETQLAYHLREFHQICLEPFETIALENLDISKKNKYEKYQLTATYFLPIIFLVMESFAMFRDSRPHQLSPDTPDVSGLSEELAQIYDLDGTIPDKIQCQNILDLAAQSSPDSYYHWSISIFLRNKGKTQQNIDNLLIWQNEMRCRTSDLDRFADKIQENRVWLQFPTFQQELIQFLSEIAQLYRQLNEKFCSIESQMQSNSKIHRDEKRVLQPMLDDLEIILESTQKSIGQVSSVISDPEFCDYEKEKFNEKNQYGDFDRNKIPHFINSTNGVTPLRAKGVPKSQIISNAMSPQKDNIPDEQNDVASPSRPYTDAEPQVANAANMSLIPAGELKKKKTSFMQPIATVIDTEPTISNSHRMLKFMGLSCLALCDLALTVNLFSPFLQIQFALAVVATFAVLAITGVLLMNHYYDLNLEHVFHFEAPKLY